MKIAIHKEGRKALFLEGEHVAIKVPHNGTPLMLEAEIEDGSPVTIVMAGKAPMPVRRLQIVNGKTYHVKSFQRRTKDGVVRVPAHDRRMPVRLRRHHKSI